MGETSQKYPLLLYVDIIHTFTVAIDIIEDAYGNSSATGVYMHHMQ